LLDAANLERMGIATLVFVTAPFESAAKTHAQLHGLPELPLFLLPNDYTDGSDPTVDRIVTPRLDEIIDKITLAD
jgi:hypothetical protein